MKSQTWSPYANPMLRWPGVLMLIGVVWMPISHPDQPTLAIVGMAAKVLLLGVAVFGLLRYSSGAGPFGRLKRLQKDLPWFGLQPVTVHPLGEVRDLAATLAQNDYTLVELDGRTIRNGHDLGAALEAAFGAMRFPNDPAMKCASILMRAAYQKPRRRVLVWRHAAESLRHDPALVLDFASRWASMSREVPPGLLLFLDLPAALEVSEVAHDESAARIWRHGDDGEREADTAALAGAPHDAWWKPKPGELSR